MQVAYIVPCAGALVVVVVIVVVVVVVLVVVVVVVAVVVVPGREREERGRGCEGADGSATQPAKKRHHAGKAERMQSSPPTRELYIGGW